MSIDLTMGGRRAVVGNLLDLSDRFAMIGLLGELGDDGDSLVVADPTLPPWGFDPGDGVLRFGPLAYADYSAYFLQNRENE